MTLGGEVAVVGGGLIGCAVALAAADREADVVLLHTRVPGAASAAAAGLLAPSIERFSPVVHEFAIASRARFPAFVQELANRAGIPIRLTRSGILDIALDEIQVAAVKARLTESAAWLDDSEVHRLEPLLAPSCGGVLWEEDGYVDNVALVAALQTIVSNHPRIRVLEAAAQAISAQDSGATVQALGGLEVRADHVVLAAGAWSGQISGARCATAVQPVRGQLLALGWNAVGRPVHCNDSYLVPRGDQTIAGSTMERVGYDPATTEPVIEQLAEAAAVLCPSLRGAPRARAWAGLRPVTPDLLPMIGRDPATPALVYACGHSRNGVLMAPTTALAVCELIFEDSLTFDLSQFRPDRFHDTLRGL